ncbi:MAG TPA: RNA-binding protein [Firmicutes bacterium]|jgi:ribosome-associated protein|nr:RNA-binding protein [Bacillota bacterium]HBK67896.1 RNA-binding protein [Bacillota bacterium]HBT15623.1 RNA-binding protein [Bacillota bacterium]
MRAIKIKQGTTIRLEQFLKLAGVVMTGGEAKTLIQDGMIKVNGVIEERRGRALYPEDIVTMPDGENLKVFYKEDEIVLRED